MEQPKPPNPTASPPPPPPSSTDVIASSPNSSISNNRRNPPSPEELVAHYEAQGLEYREASLRVIQELQGILYQTALSGRKRKDRFMSDTLRKLDNVNTRLAIVETKLDTKPGFPEALAVGVAAGSAVSVVMSVLGQIWGTVKGTTTGHPPSS